MLNRTNRTLSAHLNRLNLGTRSLAMQANVNTGADALHTRHAYPVDLRAGIVGYPVSPVPFGGYAIPSIPGSPSVSPWLSVSPVIHPRVDLALAVDASSLMDWPARSFDWLRHRIEEPFTSPTRLRQERGNACRKPRSGKRRQPGFGMAGTREQAQATFGPVAATVAAAGG
jgi:hypothetical protein